MAEVNVRCSLKYRDGKKVVFWIFRTYTYDLDRIFLKICHKRSWSRKNHNFETGKPLCKIDGTPVVSWRHRIMHWPLADDRQYTMAEWAVPRVAVAAPDHKTE